MDAIVEHCSFDYMSERAEKMAPFGGSHMSSAKAFFHKGLKRDHRTELTPAQVGASTALLSKSWARSALTGWRQVKALQLG